jgi:hypothetical protein
MYIEHFKRPSPSVPSINVFGLCMFLLTSNMPYKFAYGKQLLQKYNKKMGPHQNPIDLVGSKGNEFCGVVK